MTVTVFGESFNAEGEYEHVEKQFSRWLEALRRSDSAKHGAPPMSHDVPTRSPQQSGGRSPQFGKLFEARDEAVRLMAAPEGEHAPLDGVLAILLGYMDIKGVREVTGKRIMQSMEHSGMPVERVDRLVQDHRDLINALGVRRGKKYSLTTKGMTAAKEVAHKLSERIPQ